MNRYNYFNGDHWYQSQQIENKSFNCGYCGDRVSSNIGYGLYSRENSLIGGIYICSNCNSPNFFARNGYIYPSSPLGNSVKHLPKNIEEVYEEARTCSSSNCYTGAVLLCRKILMNISVEQGAKEGLNFIQYIDFLSSKGFIPPNGKHWVDHIREKGNEATHEISIMEKIDTQNLIIFVEMLLRFIYEFPRMIEEPKILK